MSNWFSTDAAAAVPLHLVTPEQYAAWLARQPALVARWLAASDFAATGGKHALLPDAAGGLAGVLAVAERRSDTFALAALPRVLPPGHYELVDATPADAALAVGWGLGAYDFDRYRRSPRVPASLVLDASWPQEQLRAEVGAVARGRDLINMPAGDLLPAALAAAVAAVAADHGARFDAVVGDDLLTQGFPMVHAVGRASVDAPQLLNLNWGDDDAPRVALVGKGVCFDSGGLDLKPASGMRWMKKDMGGAAVALGVAEMIMHARLPVRLQLVIPAVENAVAGNAFRPGDILKTRKGISVEIDNTDAEGRLILGDALTFAAEGKPELLLDFATLTGAARVAMGIEVPAFFANNDALARDLAEAGGRADEPVWRLPLHRPYRSMLDSKVADIVNGASQPYGGAITAALFLAEFVPDGLAWAHFDLMGFNQRSRPGRPEGGDPQALRAVWEMLRARYAA